MASPLAKQRQAMLAKQQNRPSLVSSSSEEPKSLHLLLHELDSDLKVLKTFNRIEDKVKHKREQLIPKFKPYIEEYLASGEQYDNPLFAQMVIWLFDVEDLETAIEWCQKAIDRELDTPERFKRDFATFCADEVLAWSERMAAQGHSVEPYFSQVFFKVREEWRINEKLTAKWFKFAGLHLLRDSDGQPRPTAVGDLQILESAVALLGEANAQYPKVGVSSMIEKTHARIRAIKENRL
ncbi:phage terminase small subunit [Photobacterium sp.]|uniref:phage terminase small subunit n=1 Tax=Photobacterium sp. TaxID=660 RepID=UPI00299D1B21|nr:phage terminase small subunit [Photobacterium sp.]MDX1300906.1 phage terminase small subunit [Photobacterium sp.]